MRITKFGHACVRIEHDGSTIVIDPGVFTDLEAVDGADAVLLTHEHPDHWTADHLRRADAPVFTIADVATQIADAAPDLLERTTTVAPGESLTVAGVPVEVVNERHAVIHPDYPRFHNSGYLLDLGGTSVFHPGDALDGPGRPVDVLLLPVSAPWLKASECIDFAVGVGAKRNLGIHDAIYSEAGLGFIETHLANFLGPREQEYSYLVPGADL
ncbi:MBL fold metallo-hydrolase [Nocardioides acrostichi]|uniref:MBL fold metallo-hydrolase n=1 Tax=Nocardioides acrostichi TaxID=2784339 RepID=A0A930V1W8_9ACTN|nr:MBL fold metallo-hydrolase [Nocardioides acrostichi]MBF4163887.1 MBL fold metallo-hydrolase [Nocardioides acrostichi]